MKPRYASVPQYEDPRPGSHVARCYRVVDMGTQKSTFAGEEKLRRIVAITWELPLSLMTGKFDASKKGLPFSITKRYTQSMHMKAGLRLDLEAWRGKAFSEEEVSQFDDKKLIGRTCLLTLTQSPDGKYINVTGLAPAKDHLGNAISVPPPINPPVYLSLDPEDFDASVFGALPEKMREKIGESPEYKMLFAQSREGEGEQPSDDEAAAATAPADDVPF